MKRKRTNSKETATYKVPEAARVANCGQAAIRRGVKDLKIPHIKFGRTILIPKVAFHKFIDTCGAGA